MPSREVSRVGGKATYWPGALNKAALQGCGEKCDGAVSNKLAEVYGTAELEAGG